MNARRPPTWPVLPLALPAAVAIWSGWVGLGTMTGFGVVRLLPGIWDELRINTAITLPVGMEAYAAYALHAWLHPGTPLRGRRFARVSAISALVLGALGQIAYHLMSAAGVQTAPWPITAAVACLPVGVLGLGATLAHLLQVEPDPATATGRPEATPPAQPEAAPPGRVDVVPAVHPTSGPIEQPVTQPAEQSAGPLTGRPEGQPAGRPSCSAPVVPGSPPATPDSARVDPPRKRTGAPRTDEQLTAEIRAMAERNGGRPPSQYQLRQTFGVGGPRAARLLAELDPTPAEALADNGAATRKDGTV